MLLQIVLAQNESMKKIVLLALIFLSYMPLNAQDFVSMKHALKVELGLPSAQTNKAFKEFIQGVAYAHVNYQYRFMGNAKLSPILGLGLSGNYLDVANYKIVGLNQGGLLSLGGNAKLGLEIIHDDNIIVDYHIKTGYFLMQSMNKQTPENIAYSKRFEHLFFEPGINFTLMLDDRQGVSFNISYTIRNMIFSQEKLMVDELPGFAGQAFTGRTGHVNFGFGYTLYLQKPKNNLE